MSEVVRPLHWVFKVADLSRSLVFLKNILGMHVLRHEEFSSGCEATCNGPYSGSWSKSMVGHGDERNNFVFELTYNYGVEQYELGNDLRYIAVACTDSEESFIPFKASHMLAQAEKLGYSITKPQEDEKNIRGTIQGPDGYKYKLVSQSTEPLSLKRDPMLYVSLSVSNLAVSEQFWCGALGATVYERDEDNHSLLVGFGEDFCKLELVQTVDNVKVDHGEAFGRIAFSTREGPVGYHAAVLEKKIGSVINAPIVLPTPGKADVEVTILGDPDAHEICFVGEAGFDDLSTLSAGQDFIDWEFRDVMIADITKRRNRLNK